MTCPGGIFKRRHKFEARFEFIWPQNSGLSSIEVFRGHINDLKNKVYVRDVCVRCGQTIERSKP